MMCKKYIWWLVFTNYVTALTITLVKVSEVSNLPTNGWSLIIVNTDTGHHVDRNNPETEAYIVYTLPPILFVFYHQYWLHFTYNCRYIPFAGRKSCWRNEVTLGGVRRTGVAVPPLPMIMVHLWGQSSPGQCQTSGRDAVWGGWQGETSCNWLLLLSDTQQLLYL